MLASLQMLASKIMTVYKMTFYYKYSEKSVVSNRNKFSSMTFQDVKVPELFLLFLLDLYLTLSFDPAICHCF